MIAEILQRQIAARRDCYGHYLADLKRLEDEYVLVKGLADAEAAEIAALEQKLAQLGGLPLVQATAPVHPLQAAAARRQPLMPVEGLPALPVAQLPKPPDVAPPRGLGVEDIQSYPHLQQIEAPAAYTHMRQDPYGTPAVPTNEMGGGEPLPRGEIKGIDTPMITQDMTYIDPETKQPMMGI